MTNTFDGSQFPSAYGHLNGSFPLSATHQDITRTMLAVGYPSRSQAIAQVGKWRAVLLRSMIQGYLDANLHTTPYFRNLEQSEKATMTFLIAQAFTAWIAQTHLGASYVVHVRGTGHQYSPASLPGGLKHGATNPKPRSRPDFIGRLPNGHHVLESKGSSGFIGVKTIGSALAQASKIATVNNAPPILRVAMCFAIRANGVAGTIVDPESSPVGLDLNFDEVRAARKAYAIFLESDVRETLSERIPGFSCIELDDGVVYGIDNAVLSALDELASSSSTSLPETERVQPLLQVLSARRTHYEGLRISDTSVGYDGIILRGPTAKFNPRRRSSV